MTANRIIHHIFNQPDLRQVDQASLEQLVEKYPYFAAARMLLAKKEFAGHKDLTTAALTRAQLYSGSPQQVYQFVTDAFAMPAAEAAAPGVEIPPADHTAVAGNSNPPAAATVAEDSAPAVSAEDQAILDELAAEDARHAAAKAAANALPDAEDLAIAAKYDEFIYDKDARGTTGTAPDNETPLTGHEPAEQNAAVAAGDAHTAPGEIVAIDYEAEAEKAAFEAARTHTAPDEIVAIDYEAEAEKAAFETARTQSAPDEIVAIDYEAEAEKAAFETARTQSAPDEILAIDYEAEAEKAAFEAARTQTAPDDIIAIDYDAIREDNPHYEPEPEEEDILVAAASPEGPGISIPAAAEKAGYEPEPEDEEIVVSTAPPEGTGISIPAAPEAAGEEGPIRIHPMDTPEEETTLTFQPLYTEDYFAYKKLKDPNSAEMMNEKAAAEMRSFTDWLRELKDNFAGRSAKDWYHQQLNKLYEDDEPEVSERVEKMAMDSITLTDDIVSETLAEIWVRQHQHGKAIAIYQKLSLLNPDKNAYFAQKIKDLQLLTDNNK